MPAHMPEPAGSTAAQPDQLTGRITVTAAGRGVGFAMAVYLLAILVSRKVGWAEDNVAPLVLLAFAGWSASLLPEAILLQRRAGDPSRWGRRWLGSNALCLLIAAAGCLPALAIVDVALRS